MESLIILLPLALIMTALAMAVLLWAVDDGQFDDLDGPAHTVLFDEPAGPRPDRQDENSKNDNV